MRCYLHAENKSGCMLIHAGNPTISKYMEDAIGVENTNPTHQRCIAREQRTAYVRSLPRGGV